MRSVVVSPAQVRGWWLRAQRLDERAPFGAGPPATSAAVAHLGYVQIDTIHVIERCHHHILFSRIPHYQRADLHHAQAIDKSVFEYWTHALAYVPSEHFRYFLPRMRERRQAGAASADLRRVLRTIRADGPLTIRDFTTDELIDPTHLWGSRKPSKAALELAFSRGELTISAREGMVKTYELTGRHFGWDRPPRPATARQFSDYLIDRGLRAQGVISLDSACYGYRPPVKQAVRERIETRVRQRALVPVTIEGAAQVPHWATHATLESAPTIDDTLVHILSPFDPLIIQRKRLSMLFGYDHVFEAYLPKARRVYGYFTLPVVVGDQVIAAIDLKTDRDARRLRVQQWTWLTEATRAQRDAIDAELERFERFQLNPAPG